MISKWCRQQDYDFLPKGSSFTALSGVAFQDVFVLLIKIFGAEHVIRIKFCFQ